MYRFYMVAFYYSHFFFFKAEPLYRGKYLALGVSEKLF